MDYLWGIGAKVMRLPFRWGRIQRDGLFTPLSGEKPVGTAWNSTTAWDIARIDEIVQYWTGLGGTILLDMHNYGAGPFGGKIGYDLDVPMEAWIDCWIRLASRYENNTRVWFGLMNEPTGTGWGPYRCRENMQWIVNAIRRRTNCRNKILVAGQGYSSAGAWVSSGQADAYLDFYDPANNFAFEPHCYFDTDSSGTTGVCVSNAQNRLVAITTWAKANGFKLFLGEVAGGDPTKDGQQTCGTVTPAAYSYMANNKDAWLGWTTWGYGPRWPDTYMFKLTPADPSSFTSQRPCMNMLFPYLTTIYA
jgi:endoglucanase